MGLAGSGQFLFPKFSEFSGIFREWIEGRAALTSEGGHELPQGKNANFSPAERIFAVCVLRFIGAELSAAAPRFRGFDRAEAKLIRGEMGGQICLR